MLWVCWDQPEDGGDFQRGGDDGKLVARLVQDGVEFGIVERVSGTFSRIHIFPDPGKK